MPKRRSPRTAVGLIDAANPTNPRTITPAALEALTKSMVKYGDLSGVVWNSRTGKLVGGHQRLKKFEGSEGVTITKRFKRPTATGTVALGHIDLEGEEWSYRVVDVDKRTETEMMLAANKHRGEWDALALARNLASLSRSKVDLDVVGWNPKQLAAALAVKAEPETSSELPPAGEEADHQCPKCGYQWSDVPSPTP